MQVVAHRGASADNAEHTLAAYLPAIARGADGLECDVRLTADGHLVCIHDRDLRRMNAGRDSISTMTLTELSEIDLASWKKPWRDLDDEAPEPTEIDPELSRVLTLRKLLETARDSGRRIELAIETKHPTRYGGLVERRLIELLGDFGWAGSDSPARVMSFSHTALQRVRRLAPEIPIVQLIDKAQHWPMLKRIVPPDWILGPGIEELTDHPVFAQKLAATGRDIHVWTVNTRQQLELCQSLGVSAVITDHPARLLSMLGR